MTDYLTCPSCSGTGLFRPGVPAGCRRCQGEGVVPLEPPKPERFKYPPPDGPPERMYRVANLQTRSAVEDAGRQWKRHKATCPACTRAAQRRRPDEMCGAGARLYELRHAGGAT